MSTTPSTEHLAAPEEIDMARKLYGSDDINIDEGAAASRCDDGKLWVAAWVYIDMGPDSEEDQPGDAP